MSLLSTAQITSNGTDKQKDVNGYKCFIFCGENKNLAQGSLSANSPTGNVATFIWQKYNSNSGTFDDFRIVNDSTLNSTITSLDDGGYKVVINDGMTEAVYFAWVLNNWLEASAYIPDDSTSNCEQFYLIGEYNYAPLTILDTASNASISVRELNPVFRTIWYQGGDYSTPVRYTLETTYPPIASDSPVEFAFEVTDVEFDCVGLGKDEYVSKIPESAFTWDPSEGEAVLEVNFNNASINYDSTLWYFYKENFNYSLELEQADGEPVDSFDFVLFDDQPIHKFEYSGEYLVKLVTVKMNETGNCYDTMFMDPGTFINVKVSLVEVPNVFTPNNDNNNDVWIIRTQSLKSMTVKVYNRWGGLVHSWKYSNITSNEDTYDLAVWDGRIGNRMAAPGVYYYVLTYEGRDVWKENPTTEQKKIQFVDRIGKPVKDTKHGFVHLFR